MRIIDTHAHAFADAIAPVAMSTLLKAADVRSYYDGTVSGLMSAMDRGGVALSVVAPVATKPSQVRTINDWVLSLDRDRIIPFGAMHPDFPDPSAEIARLAENGIRGIKMHSQNQDFSADEPRMAPLYRAVIDAGLVVLFHAGRDMVDWGREARPAEFARMLDAYPDLKCVLAHMGGYLFWDEVREHLCGRDVYLDTAYVPRHLPDAEFLSLIRDHGADRVLFGSDGPWTEVGDEIAYLKEMGLSDEEQELIFGRNAERLLAAG